MNLSTGTSTGSSTNSSINSSINSSTNSSTNSSPLYSLFRELNTCEHLDGVVDAKTRHLVIDAKLQRGAK